MSRGETKSLANFGLRKKSPRNPKSCLRRVARFPATFFWGLFTGTFSWDLQTLQRDSEIKDGKVVKDLKINRQRG